MASFDDVLLGSFRGPVRETGQPLDEPGLRLEAASGGRPIEDLRAQYDDLQSYANEEKLVDTESVVEPVVEPEVEKSEPGFMNQLLGSLERTVFVDNPRLGAKAIEGLGYVFGSEAMRDFGEKTASEFDNSDDPAAFVPRIQSIYDAEGFQDYLDYAGSSLGEGIGSIGAVVAGGGVGALAGAPFGGAPIGAKIGATAGSFLLNYGDTYDYLVEQEGVKPDDAAKLSLAPSIAMASLDVASLGALAKPAKDKLSKNILKRAGQLAVRGGTVEAVTETTQQLVQEATGELAELSGLATKDIEFDQRAENVANSFLKGFLPGSVIGAATSPVIRPDPVADEKPSTEIIQEQPEKSADTSSFEQRLREIDVEESSLRSKAKDGLLDESELQSELVRLAKEKSSASILEKYEKSDEGRIPSIKVSTTVQNLQQKLEDGEISQEDFDLEFAKLAGAMKSVSFLKDEKKAETFEDLQRGPDIVREKLLAARRRGEIDPEVTEFAMWMLGKNPNIAANLAISLRQRGQDAQGDIQSAGNYNVLEGLMTVFKNTGTTTTAVHEMLHHTERMMPDNVRQGIAEEYVQSLLKMINQKSTTDVERSYLQFMAGENSIDPTTNRPITQKDLNDALTGGKIPKNLYQYYNLSEFWAVNATRILDGRYQVRGNWVGKAKQFLVELIQKAKSVFGLRSDAPILKALKVVLETGGDFETSDMLSPGISSFRDISDDAPVDPIDLVDPNTKVVDESGEPLLVFHGTPKGRFDKAARELNQARRFAATEKQRLTDEINDLNLKLNSLRENHKTLEKAEAEAREQAIKEWRSREGKNPYWTSDSVYKNAARASEEGLLERRKLFREIKSLENTRRELPVYRKKDAPEEERFDTRRSGWTDAGYRSVGSYFSESREEAEGYALNRATDPIVYEVYLNLLNPYEHGVTETPSGMIEEINSRLDIEKRKAGKNWLDEQRGARAMVRRQVLEDYGFDGEIWTDRGLKEYIAFEPEQVIIKDAKSVMTEQQKKSADRVTDVATAGAKTEDEAVEAARLWREMGTESPYFKKKFGNTKVVDDDGEALPVFHGTYGDFYEFRPGSPDSAFGSAIYTSSSVDDVNANYATAEGPDIKNRVEQEADRILNESLDKVEDQEILSAAKRMLGEIEQFRTFTDFNKKALPFLKKTIEEQDVSYILDSHRGLQNAIIRRIAIKRVLGDEAFSVMKTYVNIENPVYLDPSGTKGRTTFDYEIEYDDAGDIVDESGSVIDLLEAIDDVAGNFVTSPANARNLKQFILQNAMDYGEVDAFDIFKEVKDGNYYFETYGGDGANSEFIRQLFEQMGFDGIIADAYHFFGPRDGSRGFQRLGMKAVTPGTYHYMAFKPEQIKSATGNVGTFDPSGNILKGIGVGAAVPAAAALRSEKEEDEEQGNPSMELQPMSIYDRPSDPMDAVMTSVSDAQNNKAEFDRRRDVSDRYDKMLYDLMRLESEFFDLDQDSEEAQQINDQYESMLKNYEQIDDDLFADDYERFIRGADYFYETNVEPLDYFDVDRAFDVVNAFSSDIEMEINLRETQEIMQRNRFDRMMDRGGPMVDLAGPNSAINRLIFSKAKTFGHPVQTVQLKESDKIMLEKDLNNIEELKEDGLISYLLYKELKGDVTLF